MALLKNVEPDIIFRHFVWSVLFIASVAYYINTHIMPNIAIYKEQVRFTRVTQMTLEQTRAVNKDAKSRVQSFSNINHETLQVFGKQINEATLKKYLPKGFLNINVKKTRDEFIKEDQLKKTYFTIYGETESNNLPLILSIVPKLQEKKISVVFELPFNLKKNSKNNLEFNLNIAVTQSTYKQ